MANKVTIDVEARFVDNLTSGAKAASKTFDNIEKSAKEAGKAVDNLGKKKSKPKVDADDSSFLRKLTNSERKLQKLGRTKAEAKLGVLDKASAVIDKVASKVKAFAGKSYGAVVKLRDSNALSTLNKISNAGKNIAGKTWQAAVKIKDMATAPLRTIKNMLFSIKTLVLAITAGLAAKQLVMNPINLADAYSSAKIGFSTLLGESAGQQMMNQLDAFAKATPFKSSQVISQTQRMLAMGWDAESIIDDMTIIGDAAAATGKGEQGLQQIVTALAQIKTKGKLSTEELNQLAEAGVSAKRYIAEGLGYGSGDEGIGKMTKDLENGAIASGEALQALLAGMQEYKGMMDRTANETVSGLWSQIEDTFEINIARRWGQGLQDGAKDAFGSIVKLVDEADGALTEFGDTIYDIGKNVSNWLADKFENAVERITEITGSFDFKEANLKEKISMLWNGVIADPLKEWWEGGGRDKTAETAGEIGSWMGTALTKGLLAIFGATDVLNEGIGTEAGSNIAGSFLEGFLDNFDGSAITNAFADAIGNVWGALPTWAKVVLGVYAGGKVAGGISSLAGGVAGLMSGAASAVGGFSIASSAFPILTSSGSGLLGLLGKAGVGLGASTAGSAVLMGGAGIAGGAAGLVSAGKGIYDIYGSYKEYQSGNRIEGDAKAMSGFTTLGGVGIGAAVGSIFGPVGTLLGAGIGGLAGWYFGGKAADDIRAADDAINDITASTEKLETEEEKLAKKNEMIWNNMKEHMGSIKLSMSEIERLVDQIVWGDDQAQFEQFSSAAKQAESSLQSMKTSSESVNKWMWKAGLGVKFNADEMESIVESFNEYISAAKSFAENKHYEFTAAVNLLVGGESAEGKGILESGNAFYGALMEQLNGLGSQLSEKVNIVLEDGVITLDEQAEITNLQQQIVAITEKLSNAETKAELELIKVKFGSGNLDMDSYEDFMTQMETTLRERIAANDDAFTASISSLQLQLDEGAITQEEYDAQLQTIIDGYNAKVDSIKAEVMNVELQIIGEAYDIPTDQLKQGLEESLKQGIDPIAWTTEEARTFLGVDSLSESSAGAISQMLGGLAGQLDILIKDAMPDKVTDTVDVEVKNKLTVDEIKLHGDSFGIQDSYSFSPTVTINPRLGVNSANFTLTLMKKFRGGIVGGASAMGSFARGGIAGYSDGGIVRGGSQLIEVAEEGSPEMIIPLSSQRRGRALKLWAQAGNIMGVPGFARGGIIGGNGSQDEGIRFHQYGSSDSTGGQTVQIDVGGITLEIHVEATDNTNIVEAIKEQANELAEVVAGIMADAIGGQFENTPARGGVA